jgi:hypothetical protein
LVPRSSRAGTFPKTYDRNEAASLNVPFGGPLGRGRAVRVWLHGPSVAAVPASVPASGGRCRLRAG